jgi:Inverse autotransporter, beta-domain
METHTPSPALRAVLLSTFLIGTSFGGTPISSVPKQTREPANGALTFGYEGSEDLQTGFADVLQPLFYSPGRAALFYDGRFSFDDDQQEVQSHGLVFRYRIPDRDIILGTNIYYDAVESVHGNQYHQLGLGLEVLTRWVDFRANYYLPDQKHERVDRQFDIVGQISQQTKVQERFIAGQGGVIIPSFSVRNVISGSFARREFTRFESPLEGLDTELGFLIPGINRFAEVRLFGGYYHYLNPYGRDFDGITARLEARIRKGLIADVEYSEDKALTGGHWTGGIRMSVPFNLGNIFAGKNPFEGASEAFGSPSQDFSDRMTDMVIRSHRVKTTTSEFQQTEIQPAGSFTLIQQGSRFFLSGSLDNDDGGSSDGGVIVTFGGSATFLSDVLVVPVDLPRSFDGFEPIDQLDLIGGN